MHQVVKIGPIMLASDRLLAVALILAFILAMDRIVARAGKNVTGATGSALLGGIFVARLAYVVSNLDAYAQDWWSVLALWKGGFLAWPGFLGAAGILAWRMRPVGTMWRGQAVLATIGAAWFLGAAVIRPDPVPMPPLPPLTSVDGTAFASEKLMGEPYIVNLWASWCPPCRRELPMLAETASGSPVPILLINQGETEAVVKNYLRQTGVASEAVLLDPSAELSQILKGGGLPVTLFIDRTGNVVETHLGEISRAALTAQIAELENDR